MRAAVLYEPCKPLLVEDIALDEPGPGEIRVRMSAAGVCGTDLHAIEGQARWPLPAVLGHEGAGVVDAVGPGTSSLAPGDHVVLASLVSCGRCTSCARGEPYLCQMGFGSLFGGTLMSGGRRLHKDGRALNHFFCQSSFAEYAVVDERIAVRVRPDAPPETVCLLGCGAMTGVGGVVNTAGVEPGASVAVFGCGGVGLSAIMGARLVGAGKIIAVDKLERKLAFAKELGATHTVNVSHVEPVRAVHDITGNGADYAFEAIGSPVVMEQVFAAVRPGGKAVVLGAAAPGDVMRIDPFELIAGKALAGSTWGSGVPSVDIPRFVDLFMSGRLALDRLVTRTYSLEQINDAFEAMKGGEVARAVIVFR